MQLALPYFVATGLNIDDKVYYIYGTTSPTLDTQASSAPIGSSYSNTTTGAQYKRVALLGQVSDWVELAGVYATSTITGILAETIVDTMQVDTDSSFMWEVSIFIEASPANRYSAQIHAHHDGTLTTDATLADHVVSNVLRTYPKISTLRIDTKLIGVGSQQVVALTVACSVAVTCSVTRLVKGASSVAAAPTPTAVAPSITLTTSTTDIGQVFDSFPLSLSNVTKYFVRVSSSGMFQASDVTVVHDGTAVFLVETGTVITSGTLGMFEAAIVGGEVQLLVTPTYPITSFTAIRTIT
jgi:hypothetical protein